MAKALFGPLKDTILKKTILKKTDKQSYCDFYSFAQHDNVFFLIPCMPPFNDTLMPNN